MLENQELRFDVGFLKISQLLADADIKSNPSPVTGISIFIVIQVLYSVDSFLEYLCLLTTHNPVALIIIELLKQAEFSNRPTETYQYSQSLELPNHDPSRRQQFGTH